MASSISAGTTSATALVHTADTTGALQLATNNGTVAVTINTSQNVGIGTASPAYKLDVNGDANVLADSSYFIGAGADRYIKYRSANGDILYSFSAGNFYQQHITSSYHAWFTSNNERMRIDSSGNVLVGQTAQTGSEKFGVTQSATGSSAVRFYASSASYVNNIVEISCARSGATTEYNAFCVFDNNTTLQMLIRPNGNLLNANNSYGSLSDVSLKENIVDATPKLDDLMQVKVRNYNLKDDVNKIKQIGVIAQELETVFPGMIETDGDGIKAVKYSVFVPMLVKAIQEQQALITQQAAAIEALTTRITALEGTPA